MPDDPTHYRNPTVPSSDAGDGLADFTADPRDVETLMAMRERAKALRDGERLRFQPGDLAALARALGRSPTHLLRVIRSEPDRGGSPALRADFTAAVGVPPERCQLIGKPSGPRARRALANVDAA